MKVWRRILPVCFFGLETVAYIRFLTWDLAGGHNSNWIKFGGILLCLAFALWAGTLPGGEKLTGLALALTAGADVFLLLLDRYYLLGVGLFCLVQVCYGVRIFQASGGRSWWAVRLAMGGCALFVLHALGLLTVLNGLALLYFTNFLCNALVSWFCPGRGARLLSVGLCLFLCCDLCVAVFQNPGLFPPELSAFSRIGMWLFYLPGQVLIALSALPDSQVGGVPHENQ